MKRVDLTGKTFWYLTAVSCETRICSGGKKTFWSCKCICGKTAAVPAGYLISGHTKSCGCWKKTKGRHTKHGATRSPEYIAWIGMKDRCLNQKAPKFRDYGGRGISIYKEWIESFEAFFNYVSTKPVRNYSLGRIDNNKNYEPGNVRWECPKTQGRNKRTTLYVEVDGNKVSLSDYLDSLESLPVCESTIRSRIRSGWDLKKAVTTPKISRGHRSWQP